MAQRQRQHPLRPVVAAPPEIAGAVAGLLQDHLDRLRQIRNHPNRLLHYDQLLAAHLIGFFDPVVRSLRTLDAQSVAGKSLHRALGDLRVARSTLCDALNQMPAEALLPLMRQLLQLLPEHGAHPQLQDLLTLKKRILAIDGSYFRVPADVLWALAHRRSNGLIGRQVRLDLHLDVLQFLPVHLQVDGADHASESAAFIAQLQPGVVYLADRNFVDFDFLEAILTQDSDFLVRLKAGNSIKLQVLEDRPLSQADRDAGVRADQIVRLSGQVKDQPHLAGATLRVVTLWDAVRQQEVRLLSSLLDVPAALIGQLYRHRWCIELFFRWLKCVAKVRHLFSESSNGITLQFYVMVIATLLMHLQLGGRPSLYSYQLMGLAARGDLLLEKVPEVLERIARERELARRRREKKKQA